MKIKIAYLISTLSAAGAEKQLVRTINSINKEKFEIKLFVLTNINTIESELDEGVSVKYFGVNSYFNLFNHYKVFKGIKKFDPDILHSVMFASNLFARFYKIFIGKVKIVNHIHGLGSWIRKHHLILDRFFLKFVDKIIVVSKKSKIIRINREKYPISKLALIHNSVNTNIYKPCFKKTVKKRTIVIGVAARLIPLKNISYAIILCKILKDRGVDFILKIAGEGNDKENLKILVNDLNITDNVKFLGLINDMPQFYQDLDYFLLTSKTEDLPLSIVEALSCGKKFISTDVGGITELSVDTNSFIIDIESKNQNLINNEFCEYILNNRADFFVEDNRNYAIKFFSNERHKKSIENLYSELLKLS